MTATAGDPQKENAMSEKVEIPDCDEADCDCDCHQREEA